MRTGPVGCNESVGEKGRKEVANGDRRLMRGDTRSSDNMTALWHAGQHSQAPADAGDL